ncbi:MAG: hypothetical protein IT235_09395, partial [Bacteroidia bacterium]|nr:hypothetical protein [Bacteroidia bacterium]
MNSNNIKTKITEINIECGKVFLRHDDIIYIYLKEDYCLEIEDQQDINRAIEKVAKGRKHCVLTVGGQYTTFSQEFIRDATNPTNFTYTIADAFVIKSTHQRLLANFYLKVKKPPVPTR